MTYSKFKKSTSSKTGFEKITGDFETDKVYLVEPYFVKKSSPKFSLVAKGKHISGFFNSCLDNAYLGDYKGSGLILFKLPEGLELFSLPYLRSDLMQRFCSGELNELLSKTRSKFL